MPVKRGALTLKILVQKFGGTSLAMDEQRRAVLNKIKEARGQGYKLVVVVSAMGRQGEPYATDTLLSLITHSSGILPKREQDLLLSCGEIISSVMLTSLLNKEGIDAIALTGSQAGIITTNDFNEGKIVSINTDRMLKELDGGKLVVVAGFQGQSESGEITTLGRGGSDTTAAALGVALGAEFVEIYTDVDGIKTADPRIVEDAKTLSVITYNEICHLAHEGAKVIHPRAVEIAMQHNIPLKIKSTFSSEPGTIITSKNDLISSGVEIANYQLITGITQKTNVTQLTIDNLKSYNPKGINDTAVRVFKAMALSEISVDFINILPDQILFTVKDEVANKAVAVLNNLGIYPGIKPNCAKVSAVGAGMAGVPGVMSQIVECLYREGIEILQSADSHTTIWCLVAKENMELAVRALHKQFNLGQ